MKKIIITLLSIALLGAGYPVKAQSLDLQAGELIKEPASRAVYYYGYDGKRHAFPNAETYFSWYTDFNRVKTIAKYQLESIEVGKNIVVRPGTYLIKFKNSPKVYAVGSLGYLSHIINPTLARTLYGRYWENKVIVLPEHLYSDYEDGGLLVKKEHPTGTVFRYKDERTYNIVTNGYSRALTSGAQLSNYRFNDKFILEIDKDQVEYPIGDAISYYKASLADTAQTLVKDEEGDYRFYVKIDPGSPALSQVPLGAGQGLSGGYYNSIDFRNGPHMRDDSKIDFNWGMGSPRESINEDGFSVKWTGKIEIPTSKTVDFYTYSDDGVRLYIDNQLVIDNWSDHIEQWDHGSMNLTSGKHDIRLEYYDRTHHAVIKLAWNKEGEIIPSRYLYTK